MCKILIDGLLVTCDEIEDTPESLSVNPSNEINYWLKTVVPLAIVCLVLLVAIVVKLFWDKME